MDKPAKRTWVIEQAQDPETGEALDGYDREDALRLLADLESVLFTVGGVLNVAADRVKIGEAGGEAVYESRGLVVQWRAFVPGREERPESVVDEEE
jgi:hypothetical protein